MLFFASAHKLLDTSYLCRCRRSIPAAEEIVPSLNALVDKTWVDGSGVSLLTDATAQAHSAALRIVQSSRLSGELACNPAGLVSSACHTTVCSRCVDSSHWLRAHADPLPVEDMYYRRKSNPQNPDWVTVRGISKLAGYHPHLARALSGTGYAPDTAGGIFALFNMQWNLKRGVENKGDPDTGTVEPWLQSDLAQLSSALSLPADSFQTVNIPASAFERFGVEYVPDTMDQEAAEAAEQQGMAEVEAELAEEDEALLAAAAWDAMRFLGRHDCNHREQYHASSCSAAHDLQ